MRSPEPDSRALTVDDGTRLTYRVIGAGKPVLLVNGLAAHGSAWKPLMARLGTGYRFISWDYRGLFPGDAAPAGPERHARDALAILEAERVDRAAVVGWSMGTQVAFELFALSPRRVASLILICGAARAAWGTRHEATFPGKLVPRSLGLFARVPPRSYALWRRLLRSPEAYTWARRLGLVGEQLDPDTFVELIRDFEHVSLDRYLQTLDLLALHDADRVLASVDVPTLVIAAGRDPLTSRAALERVVVGVAGAEYLVLPAATHFAPIDHADHVALRMKKFFSERGYGPLEGKAALG